MFKPGLVGGAVLAAFAVVFAILGLTPSLAWIPEIPLLAAAILVPAATLSLSGRWAYLTARRVGAAVGAGALAGAIGGAVGGAAYVAYGKSAANVAAGVVLGTAAGALLGLIGAQYARRAERA